MSRWNAYLNTSKKIVEEYNGGIPLSAWLKNYFRLHTKMGSRDRKSISEAVYNFYRLGHSVPGLSFEDRQLSALFLCNTRPSELLAYFKPAWNANIDLSFQDKIVYLQDQKLHCEPENIFPWKDELSDDIDKALFNQSYLIQPDLFLRIRPLGESTVYEKLIRNGLSFTKLTGNCIALPNATKVDQMLKIDEEVVIQDYNSQRVGEFFAFENRSAVWDCCAGSGGKSIMAYDSNPRISLTVSDSRPSIIRVLAQRFQRAGINSYHSFVADLRSPLSSLPNQQFENIIADVPCSGSGTWSRTPEQLYFFDRQKIKYYSDLQRNILSHIVSRLKNGGTLIYITCSVFKKENEEAVEFVKTNFGFRSAATALLKGYEMRSDTMFVSVLKKE